MCKQDSLPSVQNMHLEPILYINNGICNYLSGMAIIPQNQQQELNHVSPQKTFGDQFWVNYIRLWFIAWCQTTLKKKRKHDELKAKGLTQIGLFPTFFSLNCSALPPFSNQLWLAGFYLLVCCSEILNAVDLNFIHIWPASPPSPSPALLSPPPPHSSHTQVPGTRNFSWDAAEAGVNRWGFGV